MAQPKRKHSKMRSAKRRGQDRLKLPKLAKDPNDGSAHLPHHVNPNNGLYRGRQVVDVEL